MFVRDCALGIFVFSLTVFYLVDVVYLSVYLGFFVYSFVDMYSIIIVFMLIDVVAWNKWIDCLVDFHVSDR